MAADRCPVCAASGASTFLRRTQVPVHQNLVYAERERAVQAPRADLTMAACRQCGFVFNRAFDASRLDYGQDYDNTQSHSAYFDAYLDQRVDYLVEVLGVRNARVVEVGCGKGHFLRKLVAYPGAGNSGVGFDPTYVGPHQDLDGRLSFRRVFYDASCADMPADVVVCRHVIEHVAEPLVLLRALRAALAQSPQARVFFETPCVEWILRNRVLWDFFYEHCALFSAASLRRAFERADFSVDRVCHVFGGQYLWLEARLAARSARTPDTSLPVTFPDGADGADGAALARDYGASEEILRRAWPARLAALAAQGKVAVWGAGAKGVSFANLADPEGRILDCLVDINPHKQGCFVAGTGHPIVVPAQLVPRGVRNVVLMNPNYRQENAALLATMDCSARLVDWDG